jgi:uncharacterized SAM-binding protein YcdF (DUF218 family)
MHTVFFWVSKIIWCIVAPDMFFLFLVLLTCLLLWRKKHRQAKWLITIVSICLVIIALYPVSQWLFYPLETRFPTNPPLPESVDGIIVLGGGEDAVRTQKWNQVELNEAGERLVTFLALARRYPQAKLMYSGGSGSLFEGNGTRANVPEMLLQEHGLDISRLLFEKKSKNTYQNAVLSKKLANPDPNETWVMITTAWHMPRSMGIFRKVGWEVIPYPVDHWTTRETFFEVDPDLAGHLRDLTIASKEWMGLLAYYYSGRTSELFPQ